MTIDEWLKEAKKVVPSLDAELILLHNLNFYGGDGHTRTFLAAHGDMEIGEYDDFETVWGANNDLELRREGMPLAYIIQEKEFYGRTFWVGQDEEDRVLIPRTETEDLIELAKEVDPAPKRILDVGTGSGCIAITLKLEIPEAEVIATDISEGALYTARENARTLRADVKFLQSNLLEKVAVSPDLIVANLPYVDKNWAWLDKKTLSYEPKIALYAENRGFDLIFRLIIETKERNTPRILLEADPSQHAEIIKFATKNGYKIGKMRNFILELLRVPDGRGH